MTILELEDYNRAVANALPRGNHGPLLELKSEYDDCEDPSNPGYCDCYSPCPCGNCEGYDPMARDYPVNKYVSGGRWQDIMSLPDSELIPMSKLRTHWLLY